MTAALKICMPWQNWPSVKIWSWNYEALAWGRHIADYDDAWRLVVKMVDHPNLGVVLDTFHMFSWQH
ncbi:sugar phosphate isomerase/epimerase [Vibrio chagasii]|nr:sugar phosphate isomerase/epimerase [Vibrio chagasii]